MVYAVVLGLYLFSMFCVGIYGRKYAENTESFLTSGKRGTLALVTASYMASHVGAGFVVGGAEHGAQYGMGGIWFGVACALSYIVFALIMVKKIYRAGYITVADLLRERYGDNVVANGYAFFNSIASVGIIAGQIMAGQRLLQAVGMDGLTGAIVCTVIVILYSSLSGLWGVLMTDLIQMIVCCVGLVSVFFIMIYSGGWGITQASLPSGYFNYIPEAWSTEQLLMVIVPTTLYGFLSQASFQRVVASKDEKVAVLSPYLAAVLLLPIAFLPVMIGMYGRAIYPDLSSGAVLFTVILSSLPPIIGALMISAIIAAIMSTADSQLIGVAANIVHDLYKKSINPNATEENCKRLSLVVSVSVGILALIVALRFTTIISLLSFTYSILVAGMLVPVLGGYFWKGGTSKGAVAAMMTGVAVLFLGKYDIIKISYPQLIAAIPALVVFVVVSLLDKKKTIA